MMMIMHTRDPKLNFISANSATINNSPNCTPSNCVAKCNPSCSLDQVCVLGTMSECGVCPRSSCVSRSLLGGGGGSSGGDGSSSSSGSDSSSNGNGSGGNNSSSHGNDNDQGTLIGGVVGGLLGAGLVVSAAGYAGFRYRQKKRNTLPFAFHGKSIPHNNLQTDNSSIRDMQQVNEKSNMQPNAMVFNKSDVIDCCYFKFSTTLTARSHVGCHTCCLCTPFTRQRPYTGSTTKAYFTGYA